MKTPIRTLFLSAALACFFTLSIVAFAQEKPATTPAPQPALTSVETPKAPAASTEPAKPELRHLDAAPTTPAVIADEAPAEEKVSSGTAADPAVDQTRPETPVKSTKHLHSVRVKKGGGNNNERVSIGHDMHLPKGEKADAVVSVFGSSNSEGEVADAVVSVLGNSRATGPVGDSVVSVLGNTYVNSKIGGEAVAVMGDVELGPDADIGGDAVSVGGTVIRDPKAVVHGNVQNVTFFGGHWGNLEWLRAWFYNCALYARPLAIAPHLAWAWWIALSFLALYVMLALIFPSGVDKCIATLEERPGRSVLVALLTQLLAPVLVVLLCITVIGIALVPFVAAGLFFAKIFGKVVLLAWLGRRVLRLFGAGAFGHAALATLLGGVIVLGLYLVPVLGLIVYMLLGMLGVGVVVYTVGSSAKRAPTPPVIPPVAPAGAVAVDPVVAGAVAAGGVSAAAMSIPPALVSAVTLPRAGFWIRLAASLLDFLLVALAVKMLPSILRPNLMLVFAAYCVVFWALKGTTIGGIVCNLKVVRLDDRPIDWVTAIVRALGAFLSFVVACLGFIWVGFDDQKQSWHDKIAGTTIVIVPKGTSLI